MSTPPYQVGDIIRWHTNEPGGKSYYGLVLERSQNIRYGEYIYLHHIESEDFSNLELAPVPLHAVRVYSFGEQRVIYLYQNPEDVPMFIEKVDFVPENA